MSAHAHGPSHGSSHGSSRVPGHGRGPPGHGGPSRQEHAKKVYESYKSNAKTGLDTANRRYKRLEENGVAAVNAWKEHTKEQKQLSREISDHGIQFQQNREQIHKLNSTLDNKSLSRKHTVTRTPSAAGWKNGRTH